MNALAGKSIVLGVTGGIAAFKAASVASLLVQAGAQVDVVMTQAAHEFIQPLTFSAITHRPVHSDAFVPWVGEHSGHVTLAETADLVLIVPATANTIARLALGLADDMIGLVALSTDAPILVAPAMEHRMFHHPATQTHIETLKRRGAEFVGPETGRLASGAEGDGRLASPERIVEAARGILARTDVLRGTTVVVTAGGTREPLDPVRYIGNRSSGRMGFEVARAARDAGADVLLISGPASLPPPDGLTIINVETANEMEKAVKHAVETADVLIMAAAVSDFRSEAPSSEKMKKTAGANYLDVRLVRNPDIVAEVARPGLLKIGFAAETNDLLKNAFGKVASKGLAMAVANDAASTIGSHESTATFLFADGRTVALPKMSKVCLADEIIRAVSLLLSDAPRHES